MNQAVWNNFVKILGLAFLQTLIFALFIVLLERFSVVMVYVDILGTAVYTAEAGLFLFLMLVLSDLVILGLKWLVRR